MSEQDILNPAQTSLLGPDFGWAMTKQERRSVFQPQSGFPFSRLQQGLGRAFELPWGGRDLTTTLALQQWEEQFLNDYFTLADYDSGRYYTGRFDGPLSYSPRGNQAYDIKGHFVELPGIPMFSYPANWARDAIFIDERNSKGEDLVKLTGAGWTFETIGNAHGGTDYFSAATNDTAEWLYFGYGFRFWSRTQNNLGIVEVTCTRTRDGVAVYGPTNTDLYTSGAVASAPLVTLTNAGLDFYRVKLRVTGTKNASSSANNCVADAIQVMR